MNIEKIKRIPIVSILDSIGISPHSRRPGYLTYHSPLHDDHHPSFAVDIVKNRWHDFALGIDGSNIDLVIRLGLASSVAKATLYLSSHFPIPIVSGIALPTPTPKGKVTSLQPLTCPVLINYITVTRGIPREIADKYLKELHYRLPSGKEVYGAGMANISGGYALRNPFIKMAISPSDVSIVFGTHNDRCLLFEGMISFLSYVTLNGEPDCDVVIMNSVANIHRSLPTLAKYDKIICLLDNDDAGRNAFSSIKKSFNNIRVTNESWRYTGYNDMNDFLLSKKSMTK